MTDLKPRCSYRHKTDSIFNFLCGFTSSWTVICSLYNQNSIVGHLNAWKNYIQGREGQGSEMLFSQYLFSYLNISDLLDAFYKHDVLRIQSYMAFHLTVLWCSCGSRECPMSWIYYVQYSKSIFKIFLYF